MIKQPTTIAILATACAALFQLAHIFFISKLVSPLVYGDFIFISLVFSLIVTFSDFGYSSAFYKKDLINLSALRVTSFRSSLVAAFIMILLVIMSVYSNYWKLSESSSSLQVALLAVVCSCLFVVYSVNVIYASNMGRIIELSLAEMVGSAIFFSVSIALCLINALLESLLLGLALSLISKIIIIYNASSREKSVVQDGYVLNRYYTYGLSAVGDRLLNYAGTNIDKIIISNLFGSYFLGVYSAQQQLALRLFQMISQVVARISPSYLDGSENLSSAEVVKNFRTFQAALISITQPTIWYLILNSHFLVSFILTDDYIEHVRVFQIMLVVSYLYIIESHFGVAILKINGPKHSAVINFISLLGIIFTFSVAIVVDLEFENFIFLVLVSELIVRLSVHLVSRKLLWSEGVWIFVFVNVGVTIFNFIVFGLFFFIGNFFSLSDFGFLLFLLVPLVACTGFAVFKVRIRK